MNELLVHTPRAAEADELADRWLVEKSKLRELFWRPWLLQKSEVHGREHWEAARADGKGFVIVFGHMVATWAVPAILGIRDLKHYIVVGPHYWAPLPPGYEGPAILHRRIEYGVKPLGNHWLISTEGRPERLPELIAAGQPVAIAWDAPGRAATPVSRADDRGRRGRSRARASARRRRCSRSCPSVTGRASTSGSTPRSTPPTIPTPARCERRSRRRSSRSSSSVRRRSNSRGSRPRS